MPKITFVNEKKEIEIPAGSNLRDEARKAGIEMHPWIFKYPGLNCMGNGLCGTCKVQVCDGEVDHGHANPFALMDFERDEGKTLACCATLQCDTTIEADIDEEPDAQIIPVRDFAGTVSRIVELTPTIKALFIAIDKPILSAKTSTLRSP